MKYLTIILIFLTACVPANHLFFTDYVVLKGTHYSTPQAAQPPIPQNWISFQFKTNDTWNFDWDGEDVYMNKIGGIYWLTNHQCSVRICELTNENGQEEL